MTVNRFSDMETNGRNDDGSISTLVIAEEGRSRGSGPQGGVQKRENFKLFFHL